MKNQDTKTATETKPAKLTAEEAKLSALLTAVFDKDGWAIPDDAIVGAYAHKIDQMEAQIKTLTQQLLILSETVHGKAVVAEGRVDAIAATKKGSKK